MSRLSIELTREQHNAIKAMALLEGESIKEWVWKQVEPRLRKHQKKAKHIKGYGAGHKDCPLCQQFENARNGRYNKKTERALNQSIKSNKLKSYANFDEMLRDMGLR